MASNIVFKNEPKLSEHEVQSKMNERRLNLVPFIKDFISTHDIFKDKEVGVTFSHKGMGSLVSIIETVDEKLILKISLGQQGIGEGQFLRVWEQAGIKVPHVVEEGMLGGYAYTLMEYIDAPILGEALSGKESIQKGIFSEMGRILSIMHVPKAKGYGRVADDGSAKCEKFNDWILSEDTQKRFTYAKEHSLLGDEHGSLSVALQILTEHTSKEDKSSYCHTDFGTSNIFATTPLTVFDPTPEFNNRHIDLGRSIIMMLARPNQEEVISQLINGYFQDKPYDEKVLHASILLNAYIKFFNWHRINKLEGIKNVQGYLVQNKHLLEK
jgi:fructosamine-3-kinase